MRNWIVELFTGNDLLGEVIVQASEKQYAEARATELFNRQFIVAEGLGGEIYVVSSRVNVFRVIPVV